MAYQSALHKPKQQSGSQVTTAASIAPVSYDCEEISCCINSHEEEDEDNVFVLRRAISECECEEVRICTMCYSQALIENVQQQCGDQLSR